MIFFDIINNAVLISAILGWCMAQGIKIIITLVKEKYFNFVLIFASGGMPSSHSSAVCALAVSAGCVCGFGSPIFAVASLFAFITMYDAAGVRRASGEQAKILNKICGDIWFGTTKETKKDLKELIGHTPLQVLCGAILGIAIGILYPLIVNQYGAYAA